MTDGVCKWMDICQAIYQNRTLTQALQRSAQETNPLPRVATPGSQPMSDLQSSWFLVSQTTVWSNGPGNQATVHDHWPQRSVTDRSLSASNQRKPLHAANQSEGVLHFLINYPRSAAPNSDSSVLSPFSRAEHAPVCKWLWLRLCPRRLLVLASFGWFPLPSTVLQGLRLVCIAPQNITWFYIS